MMSFIYFGLLLDLFMFMLILFPSYYYGFHPLGFSLILMLFSIVLCLKMNYLNSSYWYSYLFFLLMVGGLMVVVMYLTSVSNNEVFSLNYKFYLMILIKFIFLFIIIFYLYKLNFMLKYYLISEDLLGGAVVCWDGLNSLYLNFKMLVYMFMYLFILMVVVVMMCQKNKVPMRQMMKYENN